MNKKIMGVCGVLLFGLLFAGRGGSALAVTIEELQRKIMESQGYLESENEEISGLEDEQDLIEEAISDTESELINLYTEIGVLEDEIAAQEAKIAGKEAEIAVAEEEYAVVEAEERRQYAAMKERIRFSYEQGETSYAELLLSSASFSDLLNRAEFIKEVAAYDDRMMTEYQRIKQQVVDLKAALEADRAELVAERESLEADKASLAKQQNYLNGILAQKKAESANYDAEIAEAKKRAAQYKKQIAADLKQIEQLKEEERRRLAEQNNAAAQTQLQANPAANSSMADTIQAAQAIIEQSNGSSGGKAIASYACQFIGNPYVPGGTSLTNGADCSGFIFRLYADYGYKVPRTSYQLREAGTGVSYEEAQPGDIVCYEGHVGMYIGGGMIVHASSVKTGIKVSKAQYKTIVAVRRVM